MDRIDDAASVARYATVVVTGPRPAHKVWRACLTGAALIRPGAPEGLINGLAALAILIAVETGGAIVGLRAFLRVERTAEQHRGAGAQQEE